MSQKAVCAKHTHLSHLQAGSGGFAAIVGIEDVGIKARSCACFKVSKMILGAERLSVYKKEY